MRNNPSRKQNVANKTNQASRQAGIHGDLNQQQRAIVSSHRGPILCLAAAGSGKTKVLTHRLADMLRAGISPSSILLLTFTRAAATEMIKRARALDRRAAQVEGGTFHSIAVKVLRYYANDVGLPADFSVIDPDDATSAITLVAADLKAKGGRHPQASTIWNCLSFAVNTGCSLKRSGTCSRTRSAMRPRKA